MTKPRGWPPTADDSRTECIALARKILLEMEPMKRALAEGKSVSSLELSIRMNKMSDLTHRQIEELSVFDRKDKFRE